MAFITNAHEMNVKTELDLFTTLPTQTAIESGSLQSYRPITSISNNGPIEFVVSGSSGDEYIDLARVNIHVQAKITVPRPAATASNANPAVPVVSCVNNWLHSMFSQVEVYLNQKCITPPNNCYPYRAYLETLLNYSDESKRTKISTNLYSDDTPGHMDDITAANSGFTTRRSYTSEDKIVDLYGPLHCDIFNVDKFLLSGVEMTIKLQRAKDAFHLFGVENSGASFEIINAELYVRKAKISSSVVLGHTRALAVASAKYPINRVDVKAITIPAGSTSKCMDNCYLGTLPQRCIIGFVDTAAFNGDIKLNPFHFKHNNMINLSTFLDSTPVPSKPFVCDFENNIFVRAYNSLFEGCNINNDDTSNNITRQAYANGYTLIAVDLTPDLAASSDHLSHARTGSLRIEVQFAAPLPNSVTAIIFSEFANTIEIDKNRNVITDYSS